MPPKPSHPLPSRLLVLTAETTATVIRGCIPTGGMGMHRHSQENEEFGVTSLVSLRRMGLRDAEPRIAKAPSRQQD